MGGQYCPLKKYIYSKTNLLIDVPIGSPPAHVGVGGWCPVDVGLRVYSENSAVVNGDQFLRDH